MGRSRSQRQSKRYAVTMTMRITRGSSNAIMRYTRNDAYGFPLPPPTHGGAGKSLHEMALEDDGRRSITTRGGTRRVQRTSLPWERKRKTCIHVWTLFGHRVSCFRPSRLPAPIIKSEDSQKTGWCWPQFQIHKKFSLAASMPVGAMPGEYRDEDRGRAYYHNPENHVTTASSIAFQSFAMQQQQQFAVSEVGHGLKATKDGHGLKATMD